MLDLDTIKTQLEKVVHPLQALLSELEDIPPFPDEPSDELISLYGGFATTPSSNINSRGTAIHEEVRRYNFERPSITSLIKLPTLVKGDEDDFYI